MFGEEQELGGAMLRMGEGAKGHTPKHVVPVLAEARLVHSAEYKRLAAVCGPHGLIIEGGSVPDNLALSVALSFL